ncbi:SPOR domain-containing protein [Paenibacillus barcinonensis]|uniref:SPOR domain-containing protein n=1 Tax=Paenibacillus barcinonensis TaxID=198119 RepID=A0A2V4UW70_PAEBA|nr:SPOR domain-containing protein [Paenibacillus barcinonensis]PYE44447.1 sporulation related protein [Paenibacillus barcinonensis]QKS56789.1 SPOR domain-containing protein [Paenibacillus barcinonensis]
MSNARMTFRFGNQESDKLQGEEMLASGSLVTNEEDMPYVSEEKLKPESETSSVTGSSTAPTWQAEELPVDWGGTILADASRSELHHLESKQSKHNNVPNYRNEDSEFEFDVDQGHNWMIESDNYSYKRNRPPRGWKMIGAISGALVTGALFGMVILSFFNREGTTKPDEMLPVNQTASAVTGQQETAATTGQLVTSSAGGTYYALQYGVFSSPERAEQAKLELTQAGIAAGTDPDDGNRVYAGISADREEAKLLSTRLKSQGVELYVKEIVNPDVKPVIFGSKQDDASLFFKNSSALVDQLSTLSIQQLGQSVQAAIAPEMMQVLSNQHQTWMNGLKSLSPGMTSEVQPLVSSMEKSMNSAVTAIAEYNKNPDAVHMWAVQSDLIQYVLQQKKWLEAIKQ